MPFKILQNFQKLPTSHVKLGIYYVKKGDRKYLCSLKNNRTLCKVTISSRQSNRQFKIFGTLEQEIKETKT